MATVPASPTPPVFHYRYDADNVLACVGSPDAQQWRYWDGAILVNAAEGSRELTWAYCADRLVATLRGGATPATTVLGTDMAGSVLREADTEHRARCYTPYGHASSADETSPLTGPEPRPAFNGEMFDDASGCYLPGSGHHRPYSPVLHCFLAPDALSPFDAGGMNAYAYCAGDPINRSDPTGHFWKWIVAGLGAVAAVVSLGTLAVPLIAGSAALTASAVAGAALSTVGAVAEIGAIAAEAAGNDSVAGILGWVGLGVAAVGMVTALPAIAKAGGKAMKGLRRALRSGASPEESASLIPFARSTQTTTYTTSSTSTMTLEGPALRYRAKTPKRPRPAPKPPRPTPTHDGKPLPSMAFEDLPNEERRMLVYAVRGNSNKFKYGNKDGATFHNGEGKLPIKRDGHYREYTVDDYKFHERESRRRLILGGLGRHGPQDIYTTDNHYESFIEIRKPKVWPRY